MAGAIGLKIKFNFNIKAVRRPAKTASERNLFKASALLLTTSKRSLKKSKKPSAPGRPPTVGPKPFFTFKGRRITPMQAVQIKKGGGEVKKEEGKKAGRLKNAMAFNVNKPSLRAVIGPRKSIVGVVGETHEFGKRFRGRKYPQRPFMAPALDKIAKSDKFSKFFRDSIKAI